MSVFALNQLCRQVMRDASLRARIKDNAAAAIAGFDLSDEERRAILAGDLASLHRWGVNNFLMNYLARYEVFGLSMAIYHDRIKAAG